MSFCTYTMIYISHKKNGNKSLKPYLQIVEIKNWQKSLLQDTFLFACVCVCVWMCIGVCILECIKNYLPICFMCNFSYPMKLVYMIYSFFFGCFVLFLCVFCPSAWNHIIRLAMLMLYKFNLRKRILSENNKLQIVRTWKKNVCTLYASCYIK